MVGGSPTTTNQLTQDWAPQDSRLKTQDQDSRLKTQDSRLLTQDS
ncbi:MAG: hypothetical protein ACHBN1_32235 [Heteroscytonema crispum UTEX LB 1556]